MQILSPETDNCPSWISGRERMTVENISWSISTKECCRPRRGLNPRPPGFQSDGASNWATKAGSLICTPIHTELSREMPSDFIFYIRLYPYTYWVNISREIPSKFINIICTSIHTDIILAEKYRLNLYLLIRIPIHTELILAEKYRLKYLTYVPL